MRTSEKGILTEALILLSRMDRNVMSLNESLILEAMSLKDVHQKYYQNIPEGEFNDIVAADPTSTPQKMGSYSKWLLALYGSGELNLEDLYKAKDYLSVFDKYKGKMERKDIGQYRSLPDLYDVIRPYEDNTQAASKSEEVRNIKNAEAEKVYEDNEWLVVVPKTEKAACYYGKGTKWCTAATGGHNMFDHYNSEGPLYININKKNGRKFQFHFESGQFMDETDRRANAHTINLSQDLQDFYLRRHKGKAMPLLTFDDFYEPVDIVRWMFSEGMKPEEVFKSIGKLENNIMVGELYLRTSQYYGQESYRVLFRGGESPEVVYDDMILSINPEQQQGIHTVELAWEDDDGNNYNYMKIYGDGVDVMFEYNFSYAEDFEGGVALVERDGMSNLADTEGNIVFGEWADSIERGISRGEFIVSIGGAEYLYSKEKGLSNGFEEISKSKDKRLYVANVRGRYNIIDPVTRELLLPQWYSLINVDNSGRYVTVWAENGKCNMLDGKNGFRPVIDGLIYDQVSPCGYDKDNDGLAAVGLRGKCNIVDFGHGDGKPMFHVWFDKPCARFRGDTFAFEKDGKYYFGNKAGKVWAANGKKDIENFILGRWNDR